MLSDAPEWLIGWATDRTGKRPIGNGPLTFGPLPRHLQGRRAYPIGRITELAIRGLGLQWSPTEEAALRSALKCIPAGEYDTWFRVGMALHQLEWNHSDGTSITFDLWNEWSATHPEKYSQSACEAKWASFSGSYNGQPITEASIFRWASERGWAGYSAGNAGKSSDDVPGGNQGEQSGERIGLQPSSDRILIEELANLSILAYGRRRKEAAKQLGIGVAALDKVVEQRRSKLEEEATAQPLFPHWTVEPWPEPVDGDALILALVRRIQSHVVMIPEAALTVALWIIFTWVHADVAIHSPILMVTSAEANCGKSTLLGLIEFLVRRALASVGISPAALYRSIEKWEPTLIIDEADDIFVQNEDLRSVVNSGWTRGQGVLRCEGDDHELKLFPTFCPKAIGLKGKKLPDTTASRALVVELKRKLANEKAADFRHVDDLGLHELRQQLLRWANDNVGSLLNASPTLPCGFANRVAANWHLPLAIADVAGGCWPEKARDAAAVIANAKATLDASIGIQLLEDIRTVFNNLVADCAFSKTLVEQLNGDPERPWGEYNHGRPFTQKQLANRLGVYKITSETVWIDGKSAKGYKRTAFEDTWTRYLSA